MYVLHKENLIHIMLDLQAMDYIDYRLIVRGANELFW